VIWVNGDELELAVDNLSARGVAQAGGGSHVFVWNRMARNNLTLDAAAVALGLSCRMLAYHRSGSKPVPCSVALACLGWEEVVKNVGGYAQAVPCSGPRGRAGVRGVAGWQQESPAARPTCSLGQGVSVRVAAMLASAHTAGPNVVTVQQHLRGAPAVPGH